MARDAVARSGPRFVLLSALMVVVAALVAYGRSVTNGFFGDDWVLIHNAEALLAAPRFSSFVSGEYYWASHENMYRPLSTLSYVVDYQVGGLSPTVYHVQNLLWHVLASVLVWRVAARMIGGASRWAAVAAGIFFAIHPALTEAVDVIGNREDPMAATLVLGSLVCALRNTRAGLAAALALFALALLCKESAIVTPALVIATRWAVPSCASPTRRRFWIECSLFAALAVGFVLVRFGPMTPPPGEGADYPAGTLLQTLAYMPRVFAHYLRLVIVPWPLSADYQGVISFDPATRGPWSFAWFALPVAYISIAVVLVRRLPVLSLGLAWFLLALLPVSNFFPQVMPIAERFLYLPMAGMAFAVAALTARCAQLSRFHMRVLAAPAIIGAVSFVVLCNIRHPVWKDNLTAAVATIRDYPSNWYFRIFLGNELVARRLYTPAIKQFEAAFVRLPRIRSAWVHERIALGEADMARAHMHLGDLKRAEELLRASLSRKRVFHTVLALGEVLYRKKDFAGARAMFDEASASDPRDAGPVYFLSLIYRTQGDEATARTLLDRAYALNSRATCRSEIDQVADQIMMDQEEQRPTREQAEHALTVVDHVLAVDPQYERALLVGATAACSLGDAATARHYVSRMKTAVHSSRRKCKALGIEL